MLSTRTIKDWIIGLGAALLTVAASAPANAQTTVDLQITNTNGQTAAFPGQTVTYTIVVTANVGTIAPSASATVTIVTTADAIDTISKKLTNNASVRSAPTAAAKIRGRSGRP